MCTARSYPGSSEATCAMKFLHLCITYSETAWALCWRRSATGLPRSSPRLGSRWGWESRKSAGGRVLLAIPMHRVDGRRALGCEWNNNLEEHRTQGFSIADGSLSSLYSTHCVRASLSRSCRARAPTFWWRTFLACCRKAATKMTSRCARARS